MWASQASVVRPTATGDVWWQLPSEGAQDSGLSPGFLTHVGFLPGPKGLVGL